MRTLILGRSGIAGGRSPDALDLKYLTAERDAEHFKLADRAIGGSTRLHQYLKGRKDPPADPALAPGTENPEPRTKNEP